MNRAEAVALVVVFFLGLLLVVRVYVAVRAVLALARSLFRRKPRARPSEVTPDPTWMDPPVASRPSSRPAVEGVDAPPRSRPRA